jgi:predicted O-methyltransferase YrrM
LIRRAARWGLVITGWAGDAIRRLPPRVALFYIGSLALAAIRRDTFALGAATRPADLGKLLELAKGAGSVAEIGSGPGWTALALAVADSERRVISFDVLPRPVDTYARLAPSARSRVRFVRASGGEGAAAAPEVDFLFIDSSHEYEETLDTFRNWRPKLLPGGLVVFHDYANPRYPGVRQAVAELELDGADDGEVFVWRAPPG